MQENQQNANRFHLSLCVTLLALACKNNASTGEPSPQQTAQPAVIDSAAEAEAQQTFSTRCTPCHGATGAGDGAASASLDPRPRNFHERAWQTATSDESIERIIQFGGIAVGGKSAAMPANPDLASKPAVVACVARARIRTFGR